MREFGRFLIATLCGLVLAVGVHIASILATPHLAEHDAFAKIAPTLTAEKAQIISAPGGEDTWMPLPDPAIAVAACAYDLRDGPMRVSTRTGSNLLSFAFHKQSGGVFFAVTDRAAVRGELEIVAMTARQLDEARAAEDENEPSRDVRIVAPEQQGFVIVRVAAPTVSQRFQAEEAAKAVSCITEQED
ncbi:integral membrane protein [Microvirga vignae]|uniref:Integral membrane protein n=1 Tax=Microvirga vignae TaxID=1225564 RepID=A0A0H1RCB8_9HYPH|nr:integral membrane protein [Microvirga vignae]KLK92729.1 integral membrane protein [Microvirga vignae]